MVDKNLPSKIVPIVVSPIAGRNLVIQCGNRLGLRGGCPGQERLRRVREKIYWRWEFKVKIVTIGRIEIDEVGVCKLRRAKVKVGVLLRLGIVEGGWKAEDCGGRRREEVAVV